MRLDDPERMTALRESGLLDKSLGQRLDHLVFAAARLVLADAAQVNALTHEKQYTVAGWPPGNWPDRTIDHSGCREVVLTGECLVVNDTANHPITCDLEWVQEFGGYLGVPVCFEDHVVGSLCVLTVEKRVWRSYEVTALEGVARLVAMSLPGVA